MSERDGTIMKLVYYDINNFIVVLMMLITTSFGSKFTKRWKNTKEKMERVTKFLAISSYDHTNFKEEEWISVKFSWS